MFARQFTLKFARGCYCTMQEAEQKRDIFEDEYNSTATVVVVLNVYQVLRSMFMLVVIYIYIFMSCAMTAFQGLSAFVVACIEFVGGRRGPRRVICCRFQRGLSVVVTSLTCIMAPALCWVCFLVHCLSRCWTKWSHLFVTLTAMSPPNCPRIEFTSQRVNYFSRKPRVILEISGVMTYIINSTV